MTHVFGGIVEDDTGGLVTAKTLEQTRVMLTWKKTTIAHMEMEVF